MTASAASATDVFTTATGGSAWLTGTSHNNKFTLGNTSFECTTSKFTSTVESGSSTATTLPNYTGRINETPHGTACDATIGNVTIDVNDCHYVLTGNTTGSDNGGTDATVWIQCPTGQSIKITSSLGPVISVPTQTPTEGGVTYTNVPNHEGSGQSGVLVTATSTGITATCAPAFGCGLAGIPTHSNSSKYTGTVQVTGYEDLGTNSVPPEDALTTPIEGNKISIEQS
jgi:hypothetical protein